jgi:hypothetical protein
MTKKVGDLVAITFWTKVNKVNGQYDLLVEDLYTGNQFQLKGKEVVEATLSGDDFTKTEKLTKTDMAAKLTTLFNKPFTVNYDKEKGENRTLRGKLLNPEPLLGRSYVEDLDIPLGEHRTRLVDHRNIYWLICEGTKFVVK